MRKRDGEAPGREINKVERRNTLSVPGSGNGSSSGGGNRRKKQQTTAVATNTGDMENKDTNTITVT